MRQREPGNPLAAALRALRIHAGQRDGVELTAAEAARRAGVGRHTVSRIETGAYQPKPDVLERLFEVYRVPKEERAALLQRFADLRQETLRIRATLERGGWSTQQRIGRIEAESSLLRSYSAVLVPGLMQIEAYVRAVMEPFVKSEDLERTVQARLARQRVLDSEREFHYVVTEGAFDNLCGHAAMAEQLERVGAVAQRPNVKFGVIRRRAASRVHNVSAFQLFDDRVAITTTATATSIMSAQNDVREYVGWFERFDRIAVYGEEALDVIRRTADEYRSFT